MCGLKFRSVALKQPHHQVLETPRSFVINTKVIIYFAAEPNELKTIRNVFSGLPHCVSAHSDQRGEMTIARGIWIRFWQAEKPPR